MKPTNSTRSAKLRVVAIFTAVFIAGALAGSGGTLVALSRYVKASFQRNLTNPTRTDGMGDAMIDRFEKKLDALDLTSTERAAVTTELNEMRGSFHQLRGELAPRIREMIADADNGIRAALPPEKTEQYEEVIRKQLSPWGLQP